MYRLSNEQIDYILNDIKCRGIEIEDLQLNLLDHICCIIEQNLGENEDFESFYSSTIKTFYKKELREIEEETKFLLKFKNYYTMKKLMIYSGTFSAFGFLAGSFFKIMHWPGASMLLVLGMLTMGIVFLPLMSILKSREAATNNDKAVIISGTMVGILYCFSVLFTIMHWPGSRSGFNWIFTTAFSMFIFIPIYFFNGIRKPENKVNIIVSSILMVVVTGLHFTMVNLHPTNPEVNMYSYIQNERLLEKMQQESGKTEKTNPVKSEHPTNSQLVSYIQNTCVQIKGLILQDDIGQSSLPKDFESRNIIIRERNVGNDFFNDGAGIRLMANLKAAVIKYNESKNNDNENRIPVEHSVLGIEPEKICGYSNLFVLNGVTQLQMYLTNAEGHVLALK